MKLPLIPFDGSRFRIDSAEKMMTAEASELTGFHFSRLYDDACDIGIAISSPYTGLIATFYLSKTDADNEDTYGWNFLPCVEDLRKNPTLEGWKVLVIND